MTLDEKTAVLQQTKETKSFARQLPAGFPTAIPMTFQDLPQLGASEYLPPPGVRFFADGGFRPDREVMRDKIGNAFIGSTDEFRVLLGRFGSTFFCAGTVL